MRLTVLLGLTLALVSVALAQQKGQDWPQTQTKGTAEICTITNEDYAVYSAVIGNLGQPEDPEEEWRNKREIVLEESTETEQTAKNSGWGFKSASKQKPKPETIENYGARAAISCHLEGHFTAKVSPTLVSEESINTYFKGKGDGWAKFYKDHPEAGGFWSFSAVGYSKDHQEALVYLGHHCGYLCGTGHLVLLSKEDGNWVVKNRVMLWIS